MRTDVLVCLLLLNGALSSEGPETEVQPNPIMVAIKTETHNLQSMGVVVSNYYVVTMNYFYNPAPSNLEVYVGALTTKPHRVLSRALSGSNFLVMRVCPGLKTAGATAAQFALGDFPPHDVNYTLASQRVKMFYPRFSDMKLYTKDTDMLDDVNCAADASTNEASWESPFTANAAYGCLPFDPSANCGHFLDTVKADSIYVWLMIDGQPIGYIKRFYCNFEASGVPSTGTAIFAKITKEHATMLTLGVFENTAD